MSMTYQSTRANKKAHTLTVVRVISDTRLNGRLYRLLDVITQDGLPYKCLRLFNCKGHFIKQMLFEDQLSRWLVETLGEDRLGHA